MNKEQYLNKRNQMMVEAETLLEEGKVKEAEAKMKEVEGLDQTFEDAAKAQANLNALRGNGVVTNISNLTALVKAQGTLGSTHLATPEAGANHQVEKKLYNTAFMKTLMGSTLSEKEKEAFNRVNDNYRNEMQTAEKHQILIPETIVEGIWKEVGELHPILNDIRPTYVKGKVTIIKEKNPGTEAEWVDEKTKGEDGEVGFGELNLDGCELVKSIRVSWKMKKMSMDAFQQYITTHLAEKMARALAFGIVKGKGKPTEHDDWKAQSRGVITALEAESSTPQIVEYTNEITYKNMTALMGKLKSGYSNGAFIYANNDTIWNYLANITDANGRALFIPDVTTGGVGRILGKVVKEEDTLSDGEVLLGNVARGYVMNINENVTLYQKDDIDDRATKYMTYALIDGDVLTTKAFALLKSIKPRGDAK